MKEAVETLIEKYIAGFSRTSSISWGRPHAGFAGADDPLFASLKEIVRPSHELPRDFLEQARRQCLKRCVNDALHFEGLDRQRCYKMLLENEERLSDLESLADVCGKCLVDVPCSTGIPRPEE